MGRLFVDFERPRYIREMQMVKHSLYAPTDGHTPPEPAWKQQAVFCGALPISGG